MTPERQPTALDEILDRVAVGDSELHRKAKIDPMLAAARRELQVKTELCEAIVAHNEAEDDPDLGLDGLAEAEARVDRAYTDFRQWRAEQEQQ